MYETTDLALKWARIEDFSDRLSGFAEFERTADRGLVENFGPYSGLFMSLNNPVMENQRALLCLFNACGVNLWNVSFSFGARIAWLCVQSREAENTFRAFTASVKVADCFVAKNGYCLASMDTVDLVFTINFFVHHNTDNIYIYLIVPFWHASAANQATLVEPWFVPRRDTVKPKPWRDQTSHQGSTQGFGLANCELGYAKSEINVGYRQFQAFELQNFRFYNMQTVLY